MKKNKKTRKQFFILRPTENISRAQAYCLLQKESNKREGKFMKLSSIAQKTRLLSDGKFHISRVKNDYAI